MSTRALLTVSTSRRVPSGKRFQSPTASNALHRSIRANNDRQTVVEGRESSSVSNTIFELVESINEGWRGPKVGGARDGSVEWRSKDSVVAHERLEKQGLTKKRAHLLAQIRER